MANNKVQLSDGTVLMDLTGDTVIPNKLARGYTAHNAAGQPITGTMDEGGGGTDHDFRVTADLDVETFELSNVSATFAEIAAAKEVGKDVRLDAIATIEGVATIVFSAPLVSCKNIDYGGANYYELMFSMTIIDDDATTYVTISGATGDHNNQLTIRRKTVPNVFHCKASYTGIGTIQTISSDGDIGNIIDILQSGYLYRLIMSAHKSGSNDEVTLYLSAGNFESLHAVYEGKCNGIKYVLDMQAYADTQDIPSGVYYEQGYYNDEPIYIAFVLNLYLDGVSYVYLSVTVDMSASPVNTTINGCILPELYEEKMAIAMARGQLANICTVANASILPGGETVSFLVQSNYAAETTILCSGATYTYGLTPIFAYTINYTIVTSQPSVYYEELSDGKYLAITCAFYVQSV